MTKVVIMSDSHGLTDEIMNIKEREKADYVFHCGDSELDKKAKELDGIYTVEGNCDISGEFPAEQQKTINGLTFLVVHGHLLNVKMSLMNLSYRAEEVMADIICFGHSHIAGTEVIGNRLFLNPGSIRLPRLREEKTYAVLEWEKQDNIQVTFMTVAGREVEELSTSIQLEQ